MGLRGVFYCQSCWRVGAQHKGAGSDADEHSLSQRFDGARTSPSRAVLDGHVEHPRSRHGAGDVTDERGSPAEARKLSDKAGTDLDLDEPC